MNGFFFLCSYRIGFHRKSSHSVRRVRMAAESSRSGRREGPVMEMAHPALGWWIAVASGITLLALCAYYNESLGPLEVVRSLSLSIFGSVTNLRRVCIISFLIHVAEAFVAWSVARKEEPQFAVAWVLQTFALGYPSLSLLLERRKVRSKQQRKD